MPELEPNVNNGKDMDDATKMATADKLKGEGNSKVKEGDLKSAKFLYGYAISMIEQVAMSQEKVNLLLVLLQNSALCCNKMSDWEGSIAFCSAAIECSPKSVKAFYHRSKAHFALKKF
jgi:hypothetical protein